ncbi:MAG: GNAT family N-acetyltransferase [Stellaceae bacterium]
MTGAIRDAAPADFERIAEIYAHHVRNGFGTFEEVPPPRGEMLGRFEKIVAARLPYLVAADGASVLGYAYAAPFRPRSAYRFTVEDSIYVAPEAQRRGVGATLMARLIERCAAAGMKQVIAVIGDSANAASIRVHEKCGFVPCGVMRGVGFKQNRWLDTVMMQRGLP